MPHIEHHLDAIQVGIEGAMDDFARTPATRPRPEKIHAPARPYDREATPAELTGEILLAESPVGEIPLTDEHAEVMELLESDPELLLAAAELIRLTADFQDED